MVKKLLAICSITVNTFGSALGSRIATPDSEKNLQELMNRMSTLENALEKQVEQLSNECEGLQSENNALQAEVKLLRAQNIALQKKEGTRIPEPEKKAASQQLTPQELQRQKDILAKRARIATDLKYSADEDEKRREAIFITWNKLLERENDFYKDWIDEKKEQWRAYKRDGYRRATVPGTLSFVQSFEQAQKLGFAGKVKNSLEDLAEKERVRVRGIRKNKSVENAVDPAVQNILNRVRAAKEKSRSATDSKSPNEDILVWENEHKRLEALIVVLTEFKKNVLVQLVNLEDTWKAVSFD